ncbi:hypothetical protein [Flavobacterium sp.]|uniref:hypothetical protein n=1 Tax=Flavobacterium sp. TaxID=239 RepID=UPI0028BE2241|nr:hypothetical protein [Flavobacterium sp.]
MKKFLYSYFLLLALFLFGGNTNVLANAVHQKETTKVSVQHQDLSKLFLHLEDVETTNLVSVLFDDDDDLDFFTLEKEGEEESLDSYKKYFIGGNCFFSLYYQSLPEVPYTKLKETLLFSKELFSLSATKRYVVFRVFRI